MESQLEIRVIHHPLENLAIHLKENRPTRLGLIQCFADRKLKQIRIERTLDLGEKTKLPLHPRVTCFLGEPNI